MRLLESLVAAKRPVQLIVSSHGLRLLDTELDIESVDALRARVGAARWDRWVTASTTPIGRGAGVRFGAQRRHGDLPLLDGHAVGDRRRLVAIAGRTRGRRRAQRAARLILVPRERRSARSTSRTCFASRGRERS